MERRPGADRGRAFARYLSQLDTADRQTAAGEGPRRSLRPGPRAQGELIKLEER